MKLLFFFVLVTFSVQVLAKDVKDFNQALIQDVQEDIRSENDFDLKSDKTPMRGPASVGGELKIEKPKTKVESKDRQLGADKW
jgi:hypothetical protein